MEDTDSQQFRNDLTKNISQAPKDHRRKILKEAKEQPDYWKARSERIREKQDEEIIDDGLGVFIKRKILYHGTGVSGIKIFEEAENSTVGNGIYLTSKVEDAIGYARRRKKRNDTKPVIYETSVENVRLLDFRITENVKKFLHGFKQAVIEKLKDPNLTWHHQNILNKVIEEINSGKVGSGSLKLVAFKADSLFDNYCKSLGYDGLVTFEGGEGDEVGSHDTYLIFNPKKVKINQEQGIQ